jgi:hypothetical protein
VEAGHFVVVSVFDWSNASRWSQVNQRLVVALANHVRLVAPAR